MKVRRDRNQKEVVLWYRQCGATVLDLAAVGHGCPDLLVGLAGINELVEVKDGAKRPSKRKLRDNQDVWHKTWSGRKPRVIETEQDVLNHILELRAVVLES